MSPSNEAGRTRFSGPAGRYGLEADFLGDVTELRGANFFELFAARLEFFVDLDGFLRHLLMSFLRAADKGEIVAGGDAFMSVGIQTQPEDCSLAFLLCHAET